MFLAFCSYRLFLMRRIKLFIKLAKKISKLVLPKPGIKYPISFFRDTVPLKSSGIVESVDFFPRILNLFSALGKYAK